MENITTNTENTADITRFKIPLYIMNVGVLLVTAFLMFGVYLLEPEPSINSIAATGVAFVLAIVSLYFTFIGRTQIAAGLFIIILYAITVFTGITFSGLTNPTVVATFFISIPIAAMYFNQTLLISFSIFQGTTVLAMYLGGDIGFENLASVALDDTLVLITGLIVTAGILAFSQGRLKSAVENEHSNAETLEERNLELIEIQDNLEKIIQDRTAEVERRSQYLEAITDISHDTNSILDPELLLSRVANLIAEKFDFYHVGIFLVEESGQWAVLRAVSSVGGQQMMARNHRLEVGKRGIVGYVTGIGQSRISQNIGLDYIHTVTEELPDTRSEMALPLKARGEIIGALDIQDARENAFLEDDVTTLQALADQVALAISNAQLHQQAQQSLLEVRRASGESSHRAWQEAQVSGRLPSYRYLKTDKAYTTKVEAGDLPEIEDEDKLVIPIQIRGQTIGTIDIMKEENADWNDTEKGLLSTLSEQLGVALDSARLFDETQQRASNERLVSDITTTIRESLDMETILRNAANKIRESLELPHVTIRLTDSSSTPQSTNGRELS